MFTDPPAGAMLFEGNFVAGVITGETKAKVGTDADFFDFPSIENRSTRDDASCMYVTTISFFRTSTSCSTSLLSARISFHAERSGFA